MGRPLGSGGNLEGISGHSPHWPALVLVLALASLAIRPQLLWGGPHIGYEWGIHQTLLVAALIVSALHFGLRRSINWPIVALIVVFGLNLLFGALHRDLTIGFMLTSLALLALPFCFTQVKFAPGRRPAYALVIMLVPLLSVAIGMLLQLEGVRTTFSGFNDRLEGATGNAAVFATLAFAGFAVALHEATREGRAGIIALVGVNLCLVILSGSRTAALASVVLLVGYAIASEQFRARLRRRPALVLLVMCLVGGALILYIPKMYKRIFEGFSGRPDIWQFFYGEFLTSPIFGRGIGSEFLADAAWPEYLERPNLLVPHNEYLHLLVVGGIFGFAICMAGIVLWYRGIARAVPPNDRAFLVALAPALAIYAATDNILIYSSFLALCAYLGMLNPSASPACAASTVMHGAWRRRASVVTRTEPISTSLQQ